MLFCLHFLNAGGIVSIIIRNLQSGVGRRPLLFIAKVRKKSGYAFERKRMSKKEEYEKKSEALIMPVMESLGFELVDVEYVKEGGQWYLRAYIDKEGGININDCEQVSRHFSDVLDREDFIEDAYILEVSSPGLGRALKKDKDFKRNLGKAIEFKTFKAIDGKKEFCGTLTAFDSSTFTVKDENNIETVFNKKEMALIREYIEW